LSITPADAPSRIVTISIGVESRAPQPAQSADCLIEAADPRSLRRETAPPQHRGGAFTLELRKLNTSRNGRRYWLRAHRRAHKNQAQQKARMRAQTYAVFCAFKVRCRPRAAPPTPWLWQRVGANGGRLRSS
jgi:hypothetical protein